MRRPCDLTPLELDEGIAQLRRILRDAAGFHHAMEVVPFCLEAKVSAGRALDTLEREARLWRVSREVRAALDRQDVEVELAHDDRVLK